MPTSEEIEARRRIARTAGLMLSGELSYLEGALKLASASFDAGLQDDPDIELFRALNSETDRFPLGEVQAVWNREALERLRPEIAKYEEWAQQECAAHCRNLVSRFGSGDA